MIPGRLLLGLLPPASAAPPRVLHDALVRAGPEAVVHRFESGSSARYFSVVRVGGAKNWPTRETFVFARRASPTHVGGNEHEWVSFWRDCDATLRGTEKQASGCFASSQNLTNVRSPRETNWAHNTALLWDAGAVYALGGRDNPTHHRVRDGAYSRTYETQSRLDTAARASAPSTRRLPPPEDLRGTPALRGAHAGCVEKRPQFAPNCEFDGRFSLAKLGSTYHLFARANLVGEKGARGHFGGRFVQSAASTTSPRGPFGVFSVVDVPGFRAPFARALNVYFAAVTSNPADPDNSLVALFPLRDEGLAILGLGVSCDGKRFSRLAVLANTTDAGDFRTADHPADGVLVDDTSQTALFFVHRNVPSIGNVTGPSALTRIPITLSSLRAFTRSQLPAGCPRRP